MSDEIDLIDPNITRQDAEDEVDLSEDKVSRMTRKVAHLLRQAEDAARRNEPAEEQAFHIRAFKLIAKYGIDEMVARSQLDGLEKTHVKADSTYFRMEGKYKPVQVDTLFALAQAMNCTSYTIGGRKGNVTQRVYGMPEHLSRLKIMWDLLQPQLIRGMSKAEPPFGYSNSGELRVYRRNWVRGFRDVVCERIRQAEYEAANGAGALVLYRSGKEVAEQTMRAETPGLRNFQIRAQSSTTGYNNGRQAGKSAVIHRQL